MEPPRRDDGALIETVEAAVRRSLEGTTAPKPFPGILQSVFLLLLVGLVGTCTAVLFFLITGLDPGGDVSLSAWTLVVVNSAGFLSVAVLGWRFSRAPLGEVFPFRPFSPSLLPPLVFLAPALMVALGLVVRLVLLLPSGNALEGWMEEFAELVAEMFRNQPFATFVAVVIVAPVTEEIFFRGLLLRGFLKRYSPAKAIVVSTLLFSLAHLSPAQLAATIGLGLYLGWLYHRTRNLWLPILAHAANNGLAYILAALEVSKEPARVEEADTLGPWWIGVLAVAAVAFGLWWLAAVIRGGDRGTRGEPASP
jgi:membrane protease YdiL (CAAX protease family)